ncbi:MAG: hypothetical protein ABI837_14185 [Acidobacteriota bacterium]
MLLLLLLATRCRTLLLRLRRAVLGGRVRTHTSSGATTAASATPATTTAGTLSERQLLFRSACGGGVALRKRFAARLALLRSLRTCAALVAIATSRLRAVATRL